MMPSHGDRCLTVDLGPSTFIAMTTDLPTPSTMQVPRVGKPSGTTDSKATDHGSQRGLLRPTPTLQEPWHTGQPPPSSRCTAHGQGLKSWGGGFIFQKLGLKPPTTVGKGPTVCRRLSKPLIASTLVREFSVKWDNFYI